MSDSSLCIRASTRGMDEIVVSYSVGCQPERNYVECEPAKSEYVECYYECSVRTVS